MVTIDNKYKYLDRGNINLLYCLGFLFSGKKWRDDLPEGERKEVPVPRALRRRRLQQHERHRRPGLGWAQPISLGLSQQRHWRCWPQEPLHPTAQGPAPAKIHLLGGTGTVQGVQRPHRPQVLPGQRHLLPPEKGPDLPGGTS